MSEKKEFNKNINGNHNNNDMLNDRKEWSHEWGLEKQTEGLNKKAVAKQHKIAEEMKKESSHHSKKSE